MLCMGTDRANIQNSTCTTKLNPKTCYSKCNNPSTTSGKKFTTGSLRKPTGLNQLIQQGPISKIPSLTAPPQRILLRIGTELGFHVFGFCCKCTQAAFSYQNVDDSEKVVVCTVGLGFGTVMYEKHKRVCTNLTLEP